MRVQKYGMPDGGLGSFLSSNMDEIEDNVLLFGPNKGLNSLQEGQIFARKLADQGRNGDNVIIHAQTNEVVVPREVAQKNPEIMAMVGDAIEREGADPTAYVIGSETNSINPMTGQREFFLKKLTKSLKGLFKFIAPLVTNVLFPGMGAIGKGILTGGIGSLLAGAKPKEALKNAALGGLIGGLTKSLQPNLPDYSSIKKSLPGYLRANGANIKNFLLPERPTFEQAYQEAELNFPGRSEEVLRNIALENSKLKFTDYLPLAAAGTGVAALAGAFKPIKSENLFSDFKTGQDLYEENPEKYGFSTYPPALPPLIKTAKQGGEINFPRRMGQIEGPGTETSDDIPAMLSDGEFVMTSRAVRGAGNGNRQAGFKKMYDIMRNFEGGVVA
tara:strand:+ start:390 stop:1550 length:1161 start_codon:yes stop_codon:yes gene_type:complete